MGFYLRGYYVGYECREYTNADGEKRTSVSINLATGSLAYRVYMADDVSIAELDNYRIGQELMLSLRVYVSKLGKLNCVDGRVEKAA